jgi:hypothetical protein
MKKQRARTWYHNVNPRKRIATLSLRTKIAYFLIAFLLILSLSGGVFSSLAKTNDMQCNCHKIIKSYLPLVVREPVQHFPTPVPTPFTPDV